MKYLTFSLLLVSLLLVGCGSDNSNKKSPDKPQVEKPDHVEVKTDDGKVKIALSSNDQMQYDQKELKVKEGQEVTLTLTHTGKMEKKVMGHNFVLLKQGTDLADFAQNAMGAAETDYIPEGDAVIAHTKTIGGGESASVTFTTPAKGTYDFICSFPGHYGVMQGKFIVE